jgi:hypothetical protein
MILTHIHEVLLKVFSFVFESNSLHGKFVCQLKDTPTAHMQTFHHLNKKDFGALY